MICGAGRLDCAISSSGGLIMSQSFNGAEVVQYDRTLVLAIELSNKNWVLAAQVPGLPQTKAKRVIEPDKLALQCAIDGYRARAAAAGHPVDQVLATYEAGWSGFWLARWLIAKGVAYLTIQVHELSRSAQLFERSR